MFQQFLVPQFLRSRERYLRWITLLECHLYFSQFYKIILSHNYSSFPLIGNPKIQINAHLYILYCIFQECTTEPCIPGPNPGERNDDPTRDCLGLACRCPAVSSKDLGRWWPAAGLDCSSACMGSFEGGNHYLHYLHHNLDPGKQQGGNTAPPINRKLD